MKYLYKPLLILLFFISTIAAYATDSYGYVIDSNFLQNSLETDFKEIYDLLSTKLFLYLTFLTIIPSYIICKKKFNYLQLKATSYKILICSILALACVASFSANYASFGRNHKIVRYYLNPIHSIYAIGKYVKNNFNSGSNIELQALALDATRQVKPNSKPKLIVLVVCESARSKNFSLNGYHKQTNPLLAKRSDIFSFKNVYSCGTETTISVPCMFSHLPREQFNVNKAQHSENLLDILTHTGIEVLWRDNDSGCKQVCRRTILHDFNNAKIQPYCNDFECHDEVLLHELDNHIQKQTKDQFIVLHKKGNHGPAYYKRYPKDFENFQPICQSNELQECSNEEITNTYDNIIVYTDYFLNKLISKIETYEDKYDTAMLYISDHGESLGEHGIYLHAMPYFIAPNEQIHIPFIMWFGESFKINRPHLNSITAKKFSHDNLFHSILGLYNIKAEIYDKTLDIFQEQN